MKTAFRMFSVLIAALFLVGVMDACARPREKRNLYDELWGKKLNTYVADPTDSSGNAAESLKTLKKVLEDTLVNRMTITFHLTGSPEGADIAIECDVKEFVWIGKTDSEGSPGLGSSLIDAFGGQNQGRIQAVFTVTDLQKKKVMWQERIKADVSAKGVPREEGIEMLNERLAQVLMRECFGKKRLRAAAPVRSAEEGGSL